jgi:hypothetical protein
MSGRVLGLVSFVVGLAALIAGFQVVALLTAGIGLFLIAGTAGPGRNHTRRATGRRSWFDSATTYSSGYIDTGYGDSSQQCDAGDTGGGGDCGGGDGGGGGD